LRILVLVSTQIALLTALRAAIGGGSEPTDFRFQIAGAARGQAGLGENDVGS